MICLSLASRDAASRSYDTKVRSVQVGLSSGHGRPRLFGDAQRAPCVVRCINQHTHDSSVVGRIPGDSSWAIVQVNSFRYAARCDAGSEEGTLGVVVPFGQREGGELRVCGPEEFDRATPILLEAQPRPLGPLTSARLPSSSTRLRRMDQAMGG